MKGSAPPSMVGDVKPACAKKAACAGDISGDGSKPGRPPGVRNVLTLSGENCRPAGAAPCGVMAGDILAVLLAVSGGAKPDVSGDFRSSVSAAASERPA